MIDSLTEQADAANPELRRGRRSARVVVDPAQWADRLPPHSERAEQGVLGCILWDPIAALTHCASVLPADEWAYDLRHKTIYEAMLEIFHEFKCPDLITLQQRLKDKKVPGKADTDQLELIGGVSYLMALQDSVPSAANLAQYLDIVREKMAMRKLIRTCTEIVGRAYEAEGAGALALLDESLTDLERLAVNEEPQREKHIKTIVPRVLDAMEEYHRGRAQLHGLPTGLTYLDKVLQGIDTTYMDILAGRPGDGKTSLAMNIVEHVALDYEWWQECTEAEAAAANAEGLRTSKRDDGKFFIQRKGVPVGIFSLEMDDESLVKRMMFGRGGADMGRWNTGMATTEDFKCLHRGAHDLTRGQIWIDDLSDQTIGKIRSRARRMVREHGIKLFVLDYIQLLDVDDEKLRNDRVRELAKISKAIVSLKKILKVPWLVLAQMNRNIEQAEAKRVPVLSDLKDCGSLEQDADAVMFLYRPSLKEREADEKIVREHFADRDDNGRVKRDGDGEPICDWSRTPSLMNVFVAKNRYGPTGKAELLFFKNQNRFRDLREWKVREGVKEAAAGERYKPVTPADLPTDEELGIK